MAAQQELYSLHTKHWKHVKTRSGRTDSCLVKTPCDAALVGGMLVFVQICNLPKEHQTSYNIELNSIQTT
jgi:hypothetical protein